MCNYPNFTGKETHTGSIIICPVLHSSISHWTQPELRSFYPLGAITVCFDPTICLVLRQQHQVSC